MFNLRNFVKQGFLSAIGKMSDYQIILNAAGWYEKGVLLTGDLAEIQTAINAQYFVPEEVIENDVVLPADADTSIWREVTEEELPKEEMPAME